MRGEDRTGRRTAVPARVASCALTALVISVFAWFPAPAQARATATRAAAEAAHRPTVVSLTFDDGTAGQFAPPR